MLGWWWRSRHLKDKKPKLHWKTSMSRWNVWDENLPAVQPSEAALNKQATPFQSTSISALTRRKEGGTNSAKQTRHNIFFSEMNMCRSFSERFIYWPRRHTFSFDCSAITRCLSESAATIPLCTTCHWLMAGPSIFKRGLSWQISRMTGLVRMPCEKRQNWKRKNKDKKKSWHFCGERQRLEWQNNSPLIKALTQKSLYSLQLHVKINVWLEIKKKRLRWRRMAGGK